MIVNAARDGPRGQARTARHREENAVKKTCENQHPDPPGAVNLPRVDKFLHQGGFTVLTMNRHDPNPDLPFEAWAYQGALDFDTATPAVFGLGTSGYDALCSLNELLADHDGSSPTPGMVCQVPLLVNNRELATVLAALRYHQAENLQGPGEIPDQAINEIATDGGRLEALGFDDVDQLCERLNLGAQCAYSRQWQCSDCHRVVTCSYDDLAEIGAPYCSDCDSEMHLV